MRLRNGLRVAVCLLAAVASLPPPAAAMVSTEQAIQAAEGRAVSSDRQRVQDFLAREDVRTQMANLGVSPDEAVRRVAALSDDEVRGIAGRLDQMPAGGDALGLVVGTAVLIFVILLITDIFGLTKIFPFTRSIR
jgi:hypothetical protein